MENYTLKINSRFLPAIKKFMNQHKRCSEEVGLKCFTFEFHSDIYGEFITVFCDECDSYLQLSQYYDNDMIEPIQENETTIIDNGEFSKDIIITILGEDEKNDINDFINKHKECSSTSTGGRQNYYVTFNNDGSLFLGVQCSHCEELIEGIVPKESWSIEYDADINKDFE